MADTNYKYVTQETMEHFWDNLSTEVLPKKVDVVPGKQLSTLDFTQEDKDNISKAVAGTYTHPDSSVTPGTYTSVTVDQQGHVTAGTNPSSLEELGISSISADKISGTIRLENLPHGALERLVVVANSDGLEELTIEQVQNGDTVKVVSPAGLLYFVVDETKLKGQPDGADGTREKADMSAFEPYTAGAASSVPWAGITGVPDTFPPESHRHQASEIDNLPTELKNPHKLTIKIDDQTVEYDGSSEQSITVTHQVMTIEDVDDMMDIPHP